MGRPKGIPIDPRIGLRLCALRNVTGMTQKELADAISESNTNASASQTTVYAWENGRQGISDRNLIAISQVIWKFLKDKEFPSFKELANTDWDNRYPDFYALISTGNQMTEGKPDRWKTVFESPSDIVLFIKSGTIPKVEKYYTTFAKRHGLDKEDEVIHSIFDLLDFMFSHTQNSDFISAYKKMAKYALFEDIYDYMWEEIEHAFIQGVDMLMTYYVPFDEEERLAKARQKAKRGQVNEHQTDE